MIPQTAIARPPFAVDDQDTQYLQHTKQKTRTVTREERNKASESTYDAYNTYLEPSADPSAHRTSSRDSAHDAIGGGLLAALDDSDYSDDDSDEDLPPKPTGGLNAKDTAKSKNQALFLAASRADDDGPTASSLSPVSAGSRGPSPGPPAYDEVGRSQTTPNEKMRDNLALANPSSRAEPPSNPFSDCSATSQQDRAPNLHPDDHAARQPSPTPSITPPPAAPLQVHIPVHQMNAPRPQRPIPAAAQQPPSPSQMPRGPPQALVVDTRPAVHFAPGLSPRGPPGPNMVPFGLPGFHMSPTPTPAESSTPIVPVFLKPIKPAFVRTGEGEKSPSEMSHESTMPIMRGDKEDYLPLRSHQGPGVGPRAPRVGQKMGKDGDDFWRRFSMVVKMDRRLPPAEKRSTWLESTMGSNRSWQRWTSCFGMFMLVAVVGGFVAIWWFTRGQPAHAIPVAIGGGASETMGPSTTIATPIGAETSAAAPKGRHATTSKAHARRTGGMAAPTEAPGTRARMHKRKLRRGHGLD